MPISDSIRTSLPFRARTRNRLFGFALPLATLLLVFATPAQAWKTNFDNDGAITVDGKRTFIIGTYTAGNKYTAPQPTPELYKELAAAGFNLVSASPADMDAAHAAGLMTWTAAGVIDLKDPEASAKALTDRVNAVKGHP